MRRQVSQAVAFVVFTAAALWIIRWWETQTGWRDPSFWFGGSFVALAWVIVLNEFADVCLKLPNFYHRLRPCEADGRLYRDLGVRLFKRFVVDGDYMNRSKRAKNPAYRVVRTRSDAVEREHFSRTTELAHLLHLLLLLPAIALSIRTGRPWFAAATTLLLVGFDLYPILLQRYNRARVSRLSGHARPTIRAMRAE